MKLESDAVVLIIKVISMKTLIIKALLTSLYQREEASPSLVKRGEGRFFNNDINQEGG
jgi:hypothetical protein